MPKSNPKEMSAAHPPEGWPRWLWFLATCFVDDRARLAFGEKQGVLSGISSLSRRLDECRKDREEWRLRALSAERVISHEVPEALKAALTRHDDEHKTCLSYRF